MFLIGQQCGTVTCCMCLGWSYQRKADVGISEPLHRSHSKFPQQVFSDLWRKASRPVSPATETGDDSLPAGSEG